MKSPITGKEMLLCKELRQEEFRKEIYNIIYHYYKCEDSDEQFTTTELDELNMAQLLNQYRYFNNIPFTDEIVKVREKYKVSGATMAEILGFGINTYRHYEAGEIPSKANAKLINIAANPAQFRLFVETSASLGDAEKDRLLNRIAELIDEENREYFSKVVNNYIFGSKSKGSLTGFKKPDADKITQMIIFFAEKLSPSAGKMNKLLFYADFLNFKRSAVSISGMQYVATNYGPVPDKSYIIFEYLTEKGHIEREIQTLELGLGIEVTNLVASNESRFDSTLFSDVELKVLNSVAEKFKNISTREIIKMTQPEIDWIVDENNKSYINYEYAFQLEQL